MYFAAGGLRHIVGKLDSGVAVLRLQFLKQLLRALHAADAEQHTVDRLKDDAVVVHVLDLDQRVARRMVLLLLGAQRRLDLFPVRLCGCEAVVAVAHREQQRRVIAVLRAERVGVGQRGHRVDRALHVGLAVDEPAGDVTAVEHEIGVVDRFERVGLLGERLDDGALRIVDQNEDVRQLQRRALADSETRRNALDDRALGGADQRRCALVIIIAFEIERHDKSPARVARHGTSDQHKALRLGFQDALRHILAHVAADRCDALRFAVLAQERFRQEQVKRRRSVADVGARRLPVFGLRGELVARDDRPLRKVRPLRGKHHIGYQNTDFVFVHVSISFANCIFVQLSLYGISAAFASQKAHANANGDSRFFCLQRTESCVIIGRQKTCARSSAG